jgi:hypothetical protein
MNSRWYRFILLPLVLLGCYRPALHPVVFHDLSQDHPVLSSFIAWQSTQPEEPNSFQAFSEGSNGKLSRIFDYSAKPLKPFSEIGTRLYYPPKTSASADLNESTELVSADENWAIKTYSIKTFADDLNNDTLVIRNIQNGQVEKVKVPSLSNGEMFPLFWNPRQALFYFMTSVGDDNGRSLELWEYDLNKKVFLNIGDTNGDAYMSPDGAWVAWETGPTFKTPPLKKPYHSVWLCAYDTVKKANYQLTDGPTISFFQRWETP